MTRASRLGAVLDGNAWGVRGRPDQIEFCLLEHWDRAFTWIGNHRAAIEDVGDAETPACTRVCDLAVAGQQAARRRSAGQQGQPAGAVPAPRRLDDRIRMAKGLCGSA